MDEDIKLENELKKLMELRDIFQKFIEFNETIDYKYKISDKAILDMKGKIIRPIKDIVYSQFVRSGSK
jgi:hypothetical protein